MKKRRLSMRAIPAGILISMLTACVSSSKTVDTGNTDVQLEPVSAQGETSWQDSQNRQLDLDLFTHQPHLLTFFYSSCTNVCPRTMASLRKLDSNLKQLSSELPVILVTLEPDEDSPDSLESYRQGWGMQRDNWHFVRGDNEQTLALARSLGYAVVDIEDHVFHDSTLYLYRDSNNRYQAYDSSLVGEMKRLQQDIELIMR